MQFQTAFASIKTVLASAVVALAAAACIASSPVAAPTPAPTPTPTPTPVPLVPVRIDRQDDPEGFLKALPAKEVECAALAAGGRQTLVSYVAGKATPDSRTAQAVSSCASDATAMRVVVGQIELSTGPLSDKTLSCVAGRSANLGLSALFGGTMEAEAVVGLLQAAFCLDPQERYKLEQYASTFNFGKFGIDEIECFVDQTGPAKLAQALSFLQGSGDIGSISPEFVTTALDCGLVSEAELAKTGFTSDQLQCLADSSGANLEKLLAFIKAGETADPALLADLLVVLEECGVDLAGALSALPAAIPTTVTQPGTPVNPGTAPTPTPAIPSVSLTPEQISCLMNKIGADVIADVLAGNVDVAKLLPLIGAISECGIDVSKMISGAS